MKFLTYTIIWSMIFVVWSTFLYGMLWLFSYENIFSWKISLGVMVLWIIFIRIVIILAGKNNG